MKLACVGKALLSKAFFQSERFQILGKRCKEAGHRGERYVGATICRQTQSRVRRTFSVRDRHESAPRPLDSLPPGEEKITALNVKHEVGGVQALHKKSVKQ